MKPSQAPTTNISAMLPMVTRGGPSGSCPSACLTLVKSSSSAISITTVMTIPICRLGSASASSTPTTLPSPTAGASLAAAGQSTCLRRWKVHSAISEPISTGRRLVALAALALRPNMTRIGRLTAEPEEANVLRNPQARPAAISTIQ
jgi:hypothetical protein